MISYKIFILFLMLLMHYIEDFHLQGCLANLKQKKWWVDTLCKEFDCDDKRKEIREPYLTTTIYKNDYKMSLFAHSLHIVCRILGFSLFLRQFLFVYHIILLMIQKRIK